ncbi:LppP/LprE family lipoprotein [Frigoribacterium sp. 2-23]|uniref:LppP/LprE family lipoprotein n=1 Tax=Frigoribacterium sp. 2-23 TaxID=3415006 RepID=UPI003C6EACD8
MTFRTRATIVVLGAALLASVSGCTSATSNGASPTASEAPPASSSGSSSSAPSSSPTCGPNDGTEAAADGIAALAVPSGLEGHRWDAANADYSGYDACAPLSWSVVTLDGSTPSSPYAVLLFHDGTYLGTATKQQYAFSPVVTRASDTQLDVSYRYPQGSDSNADPTGRAEATYTWNTQTQRVDMTGQTPPAS